MSASTAVCHAYIVINGAISCTGSSLPHTSVIMESFVKNFWRRIDDDPMTTMSIAIAVDNILTTHDPEITSYRQWSTSRPLMRFKWEGRYLKVVKSTVPRSYRKDPIDKTMNISTNLRTDTGENQIVTITLNMKCVVAKEEEMTLEDKEQAAHYERASVSENTINLYRSWMASA